MAIALDNIAIARSQEFPRAAPSGTPSTSCWYFPVLPSSRLGTDSVQYITEQRIILQNSKEQCRTKQCSTEQLSSILWCPWHLAVYGGGQLGLHIPGRRQH